MTILNFEEKVEKFKKALEYPFWTLSEAECYFNNELDFYWYYHLHPIEQKMFGRLCFGWLPMREEYADGKLERGILYALETKETSLFKDSDRIITKKNGVICRRPKHITKIQPGAIEKLILETEEGVNQFKHKITLFTLKLRGVEYSSLGKFMYFFDPHEFIALVVTEGIKLPLELQRATSLFQKNNCKPLSESSKKQVKRQAIAQAFWHKYPNFSISEITRRFSKLKNFYSNSSFGFINESVNRNRAVIKALQPKDSKPVLLLPGIIQKNDGVLTFDFQKLKIAVDIIAYLLIRTNNKITENEILSHPLIGSYINLGGDKLKYIIEYSLREAFEFLATD